MKRLVCIVEGKGDVDAIPVLCNRILHWMKAPGWIVDKRAIRLPRTKLVDGLVKGPGKPCKPGEMARILALAAARDPDAVLVLCDADDECPGVWSASVPRATHDGLPVAAVMAVREYEAWLLWTLDTPILTRAKLGDPERIRDAKGALARIDPSYQPTIHQLPRTRGLDVTRVAGLSRSFRKLIREIARVCDVPSPFSSTPSRSPLVKKTRASRKP